MYSIVPTYYKSSEERFHDFKIRKGCGSKYEIQLGLIKI